MIICICCSVNEATIKEKIRDGAKTIKEIQRTCRVGIKCGMCIPDIKDILRSYEMNEVTKLQLKLEELEAEYDYLDHEKECIEARLDKLDKEIAKLQYDIDSYEDYYKEDQIQEALERDY